MSDFEADQTETTPSNPSSSVGHSSPPEVAPAWRPLTARQRRVLGTLMEKSKTTPDAYPMTMTGLTTGCNQKSNRSPVNNYSQEQIEETVDQLRDMGAAAVIHGNGRVVKIRHYGYQWLGLTKTEAAVMTELLLRGEQTVGELRTRASRMEPLHDLHALQQVLESLQSRKLVLYFTPVGRGQIISHGLYQDHELNELRKQIVAGGMGAGGMGAGGMGASDPEEEATPHRAPMVTPAMSGNLTPSRAVQSGLSANEMQVAELKRIVDRLVVRVTYLEEQLGVQPPE